MKKDNKTPNNSLIKGRLAKNGLAYALIAPSVAIILIFLIVPIFYAVYCSLYKCDYMNFTKFVGLGNYKAVLSHRNFTDMLMLTMRVSFTSLAFAMVFGVLVALWIHSSEGFFAYILELIILIPWVVSMIVSTMLWKWLLQDELGLINYLLKQLGLSKIGFLTDKTVVVWSLIFILTWRLIAYVMVQVLAGLKAIPLDYEEAAMLDGANSWQRFWHIRVPLLKTPLTLSCIIVLLSNLNNVVVPLSLTGGGPGTATTVMAINVYKEGFTYFHFGESSALSILMCLFNFILILIYIKAVKYDKR